MDSQIQSVIIKDAPLDSSPILEVKHLSKNFDANGVLKDVSFAMKEQGGYYDQWVMHQLVRSENREDYPDLTDEAYANFRAVTTTGIGAGKLYRSSSPVNPEINRNHQADAAAEKVGVKTFVNLADAEETMKGYEGFADSYYSKQNYICLNLGVDFSSEEFRHGLAEGLRFIAKGEAPFLVHCNEGKDRAGFATAIVLESLGASRDDIIEDYLITNEYLTGVVEHLLATIGRMLPSDSARQAARSFFRADERYLEAAYDEAATRFGSFEAFCEQALGIDAGKRAHMRELFCC